MLQLNWNLLFTVINVIVFYLLMKKFLYGPITRVMEQRRTQIEDGLNNARQTREQADALKKQYDESLQNARQEAEQILTEARAQAAREREQILQTASEEARQLLTDTRAALEEDRRKAEQELRLEIAALAMRAAVHAVGEKADVLEDAALYDRFLETVGVADGQSQN